MNTDVRQTDRLRKLDLPASPIATSRPRGAILRVRAFAYVLMLDLACIVGSFAAASAGRGTFFSDSAWLTALLMLIPLYVGMALSAHAYSVNVLKDPFSAVARSVKSITLAMSTVVFLAFCLKNTQTFPRLTLAIGSLSSVVSLALVRYFFARNLIRIVGGDPHRIALIHQKGQATPDGYFAVVLSADAYFDGGNDAPSVYAHLARSLDGVDRVVVACCPERRLNWAHMLKGANIQGEIIIPEFSALAPLAMGNQGASPTLVVAAGALDWFDRGIKRSFDLVVAMTALITLLPLLAIVAVAIKLDGPGPILFQQTRIGRSNRPFCMVKFRSMRMDSCDTFGGRSTARGDGRITRVGNIIRKTSIDELPQLLNILIGDMSVVGPRPHALGSRAADKLFWEVDERYWHRHATKPGLTGLAQVRGYRGATILENDLINRLQADLEYVEKWSIWRDLKIIAMTFRVLLHRNAF